MTMADGHVIFQSFAKYFARLPPLAATVRFAVSREPFFQKHPTDETHSDLFGLQQHCIEVF
jgi:hypothetical protein